MVAISCKCLHHCNYNEINYYLSTYSFYQIEENGFIYLKIRHAIFGSGPEYKRQENEEEDKERFKLITLRNEEASKEEDG